jgi:hypothetical protein
MTATSISARPASKIDPAGSRGACRRKLRTTRVTHAVMHEARHLWPHKTAAHLVAVTGYSQRSCEAWLAGESKIPADAIAALFHSNWGLDFVAAVMAGKRPAWWDALISVAADVHRRRAADRASIERALIERALDADRSLLAAIERAEAAWAVSAADGHGAQMDALCEAVREPDCSLARTRGQS